MHTKKSERETLLKLINKMNESDVQKVSIFLSGLEAGKNMNGQHTTALFVGN